MMYDVLNTFFAFKGIVHFSSIPQSQSAKKSYNTEILKRLREHVHRKRLQLWPNDWILHHDIVPAHKALSIKQCLEQKSITDLEHTPCSPDFASNDFWLFPKNRICLKE
jgi:hypothetical protein